MTAAASTSQSSGCCPSLKVPMTAALEMPMWECGKAPPR